jgi:hypothetical protein
MSYGERVSRNSTNRTHAITVGQLDLRIRTTELAIDKLSPLARRRRTIQAGPWKGGEHYEKVEDRQFKKRM